MKLNKIDSNIKCDTVLCFNNSYYEIISDSYKGNFYLCPKCFNELKKLFKEPKQNETK